MSMGHLAGSGYILPATYENLVDLIGSEKANEMVEEYADEDDLFTDCVGTQNTINGYLAKIPVSFTVFEIMEDDLTAHSELDVGMYFYFEESDLYERALNLLGKLLEQKKILPQFARWTHWG
jgi:hypothetical protein